MSSMDAQGCAPGIVFSSISLAHSTSAVRPVHETNVNGILCAGRVCIGASGSKPKWERDLSGNVNGILCAGARLHRRWQPVALTKPVGIRIIPTEGTVRVTRQSHAAIGERRRCSTHSTACWMCARRVQFSRSKE